MLSEPWNMVCIIGSAIVIGGLGAWLSRQSKHSDYNKSEDNTIEKKYDALSIVDESNIEKEMNDTLSKALKDSKKEDKKKDKSDKYSGWR